MDSAGVNTELTVCVYTEKMLKARDIYIYISFFIHDSNSKCFI